ncbi:hypothetical protein SCLCIDRAFT_1223676 [Scleroderma citrinum Foug A]|uniref:GH3 auxin-responsive promoter n=1 Tax=Scleroderma citrinum Foug A TaxID=1036808 RepID=A0A0C2ZI80_9AGAM|nr:hypothetical protein SCLCIDRAFT_1223676 [Scleroderma citrinum Foug A]
MTISTIHPLSSLSLEDKILLRQGTDRRLREIICANIATRFASSSSSLVDFRLAVANRDVKNDATILDDFRRLVPLTEYEAYRPLLMKFKERPCKLSEVENLLAPGLPDFLCESSSTSGKESKVFPKHSQSLHHQAITDISGNVADIYSISYRDLLQVVADSGEAVHTVPLTVSSTARWRTTMNWSIETDDARMGLVVPGHVAPWATGLITHHQPFLFIHALFALADPHVDQFRVLYIPIFMDIVHVIQAEWEVLLSSIRDGTIPDIEHIDHVQAHLQDHMRADPKRAEELRHIGPPLSCPGWAQHVWPRLTTLMAICSGVFSTALPKARTVLGPNITIHNFAYGCTEGLRGKAINLGESGDFILDNEDVVEFLDVTNKHTTDNIVQAWDIRPGTLYQPVYTSRDGLWRYRIDDIIQAIGFHPRNGLPVFKFFARKNLSIRIYACEISETALVDVIRTINEGFTKVHEFTAVLDDRDSPETVGFFFEVIEDAVGSNVQLIKQKTLEAFSGMHVDYQEMVDVNLMRQPIIRIVKPGTFMEYRRWRVDSAGVGINQVKVPVVMLDSKAINWMMERVVMEL